MEDLPHYFPWLLLHRVDGLGPRRLQQLIDRYQSPLQLIYEADPAAMAQLGLPVLAELLIQKSHHPVWQRTLRDLDYLITSDIRVMTWACDDYPVLLREIASAPPVLFIRGQSAVLSALQVGIVGSRKASKLALQISYDWSRRLTGQHVAITSGLALGVDGAAHRGAIDGGGLTIAVMAQGIDQIYPKRHQGLAEQIIEHGALVSEFPLSSDPKRDHFPRRNRIISGLSHGVLVVEAARKSGSLITARYAAEQNRDVFAIPGSIHNPQAEGCHDLIKQGAFLAADVDDILQHFPLQASQSCLDLAAIGTEPPPCPTHLQPLLTKIPFDYTHLDILITESGTSAAELSSQLLELEMDGWVENQSAHYRRIK
ncbi:DNA processing protein DprA [BD1-7 clade bacterium]|uniref:DNA processing protein DprA n=1 Tax=BD1-7 clade bacterium TaxID=2029982 RepID=A0A5S9N3R6_9GAMM|nr:DNA processing protein DprA [BD1-7 clade bacterium]CAA0083355.1 DNA processing protein DprA [BD1-7 clade bacterium]